MWAWAHRETDEPAQEVDPSSVVAVLVAHNGDQWLPRTLLGLARSTPRPGALLAVDAGSEDDTARILNKSVDEGLIDRVVVAGADMSFGACVNAALADYSGEATWLWLLHDDVVPGRDALRQLLVAADQADPDGRLPSILVPKLLHPKRRNHPDQMRAIGESITGSGMRVLTVEPGDIDQHQQEATAVLGASTAGMLVSRKLWNDLGGTRDFAPLFRDGVDLGWRANARGLLVRTAPAAAMRHGEVGRIGLRTSVLAPDSARCDLAAGMAVAAAHSADPTRAIRRMTVLSYLRALSFLLGKSPALAGAQLAAAAQTRAQQDQIIAAWQAEQQAVSEDRTPAELLPARGWGLRRVADRLAGAVSDRYYDFVDRPEGEGLLDELTGDDFAGGRNYPRFLAPAILGMIIMLLASLVASRSLLATGMLTGPGFFPAPDGFGSAWSAWARSEPGMAGANAPWLLFGTLGAILTLGHPDIALTLLILGGPALAGLAAFRFMRPVCGRGHITMLLAMTWGILLPVTGVSGSGHVDLTILAILLPGVARYMRAWQTDEVEGPQGWRAPAALAITFTILTAMMPLAWLAALAVAVWIGLKRSDLRGGLVVGLSPLVTWVGWLPRLATDPGRLLVGADPAVQPAGEASGVLQVLTCSWTGTPLWLATPVIALVWGIGLVGAVRARGMSRANLGLLLASTIFFPLLGLAGSRIVVTVAGVPVRPNPLGGILIGLFALIILAAYGLGRSEQMAAGKHDQSSRLRSVIAAVTALVVVLGGGWWLGGALNPLGRSHGILPSYVVGVQNSDRATRTLLIDLTTPVASYGLTDADHPSWGSGEIRWPLGHSQANAQVAQLAQQFAQGQASDNLAARLSVLAIGHVWLRGAGEEQVSALSASPELNAAPADETTVVFTVASQPSFAALIDLADGQVDYLSESRVPTTAHARYLVLAAPADSSWRVSIGGHRLERAESVDWRQTFELDGHTGQVEISRSVSWLPVIWESLCWVALLVMAAPSAGRTASPRRALPTSQTGRRTGDE